MSEKVTRHTRIAYAAPSFALSVLGLPECPASPNCVSSHASDPNQKVAPFDYQGFSQATAKAALLAALKSLPRTTLETQEDEHFKAVVQSCLFSFVDDLDFVFDDKKQQIHVRSASRVGYWDLGVNRRRIEKLRKVFERKLKNI